MARSSADKLLCKSRVLGRTLNPIPRLVLKHSSGTHPFSGCPDMEPSVLSLRLRLTWIGEKAVLCFPILVEATSSAAWPKRSTDANSFGEGHHGRQSFVMIAPNYPNRKAERLAKGYTRRKYRSLRIAIGYRPTPWHSG